MEREFPKNVKQIGNVCDEPKIYVEDYVDTYLNQLKEKAAENPVGAVLTGEILSMDGQDVVYVAGALKLHEIEADGGSVIIRDEVWEKLEEEKQSFFSGQEIVGWCLLSSDHPMGMGRAVGKVHERLFSRENTVFIWKDPSEPEEIFYANKFGELMQIGGHYIFYEKNPSMQNYMINTRKKIGVTPCEMVEDRAAKNFRSAVREKAEYKEQRQNAKFVYAMSVALVVIVLVIGVSTINNYDRMEAVQNSLEALSRNVSQPEAETASVDNSNKEDGKEEKEESTAEDVKQEEENTSWSEEADSGSMEDDSSETVSSETASSEMETSEKEVTAAEEPQTGEEEYYVVQKGDTLDGISIKVYGNRGYVDAICRMNGLEDGNLIIIGQKLLLP